jgi:hypothetical protein
MSRPFAFTAVESAPIPPELVPPDANVELEAKKAAGYQALTESRKR